MNTQQEIVLTKLMRAAAGQPGKWAVYVSPTEAEARMFFEAAEREDWIPVGSGKFTRNGHCIRILAPAQVATGRLRGYKQACLLVNEYCMHTGGHFFRAAIEDWNSNVEWVNT